MLAKLVKSGQLLGSAGSSNILRSGEQGDTWWYRLLQYKSRFHTKKDPKQLTQIVPLWPMNVYCHSPSNIPKWLNCKMGCLSSKEGNTFNEKQVGVGESEHITGLTKKQRYNLGIMDSFKFVWNKQIITWYNYYNLGSFWKVGGKAWVEILSQQECCGWRVSR